MFGLLLSCIVGLLYLQNRQREWTYRLAQAEHRLDTAYEKIATETSRVRADALFLADQIALRQFVGGDVAQLGHLQQEYSHFVNRKQVYDQIRLIDLSGQELLRVNYAADGLSAAVQQAELQDKSDRYYFRESRTLRHNEIFVSEFDLNLEFGNVEFPIKPVIRFVTPVLDDNDQVQALLVLNYLGGPLLQQLDDPSVSGGTMLLRPDGQYVRGRKPEDAWGWLLGHDKTFKTQFPQEASRLADLNSGELTPRGAFATRTIPLGKAAIGISPNGQGRARSRQSPSSRDYLIAVSFLPREQIFAASNELLQRLLILAACIFLPVIFGTRYWAQATLTKQQQAVELQESEAKLRGLSSRLLRIQEDERRAMSREIHDQFGQQVTAINLDLKLAARNLVAGTAKPHLERAIGENETLLQCLHSFATKVRPAVLDDLGLQDALESHLSEFEDRTRISVKSDLRFQSNEIPGEVADNCYRLIQESLNNVLKHAEATIVEISVHSQGGTDLHLAVRDDGKGYAARGNQTGLGLIGMQERVDLLGGSIMVDSNDGGTSINITLPIRPCSTGIA